MESTFGKNEIAAFGGGCFWCTEAVYQNLKGVFSVMPGYSGGASPVDGQTPTYEEVSSGKTGHAEVIKIEYDPSQISYRNLLTIFFATHDPTTLNRQGNDVGSQYRSAIFYTTPEQEKDAKEFIEELNKEGERIVTELKPFDKFYEAESYHQDYYLKNSNAPYCQIVINPKLEKLKAKFTELLKTSTNS